ncbi:MAG: YdgA family protein [Desulfohalobiaceae bacterium]|nr:YdgA family protein [Desulfohalobiaceae bacterium]
MGRPRVLVGIGILVIAGLVVFSFYYVGGRIQRRYAVVFAKNATWAQRTHLRPELIVYDRGVFTSRARTRISLRSRDAPAMLLRHKINHGPFFYADRYLGLGRVETTAEFVSGNHTELQNVFEERIPLRARTYIALDGSVLSRVTSPSASWKKQEMQMVWGGMNASIAWQEKEKKKLNVDFYLPRIKFSPPEEAGEVLLSDMRWQQSVNWNQQDWIEHGEGSFTCSRIKASSGEGRASLEDISLESRTQLQKKLLRSKSVYRFRKGRFGDFRVPRGNLTIHMENIDPAVQAQMGSVLYRQSPDNITREEVEKLARGFLSRSPELESTLHLKTEDGSVRMDISSVFDGSGKLNLRALGLVSRLSFSVRGSVPQRIGVRLAALPARFIGKDQSLGEEEALSKSERVERQARKWLKRLREKGYITRDSGSYASSLQLKQGMLTINDKPFFPLKDFFGSQ